MAESFDPKKYLNQIRFIDNDIQSRQEEAQRLRSSLYLKTSTVKDDAVQEGGVGFYDDKYIKLLEKTESINQKVDQLVDTKIKVSNEIDLMDNRVGRIILREKYLNLKTFEEIAESMDYDLRHTYKLHGEALKQFKDAMLRHCMTLH